MGLRHARGRYVLLTEDDIVLPRECLDTFVAYLQAHPATGIATGMVVEQSSGEILYASGEVVLDGVFRMNVLGRGERERGQYAEPMEARYAPGCAVFASRALMDRLGGFRDDFFLYYEDAELCLRVLAAGLGITCLPRVRIMHHASAPTADAGWVDFHKIKNLRALYLLHAPARVLPEFLLRYGVVEPARALVGDQARFLLLARAWWWIILRLPKLLADRRRVRAPPRVGP